MKETTQVVKGINRFLEGDEHAFDDYDGMEIKRFDTIFFNTPIHCEEERKLAAEVQKLLTKLDVPADQAVKYLRSTSTVHGLLKLLAARHKEENRDAHKKLDEFIEKIDNFQLIKTLEFMSKHLEEGGDQDAMLEYMKSYDKKMAKVNTDFYETTISSDLAIKSAVENILRTLGVPDRKWGRYIGTALTVHGFLQELTEHTKETPENKEKLEQLKSFVNTIDTKSKISRQKALLYGLGVLLPIMAIMPVIGYGALEQIVTAALFTPVLGLVAAVGIGAYGIYQTTFNKNLPLLDKIRENTFILASTILKVAAYSLVIATATTAAPVAAVLTAVAAGIGVVQQSFKLLQMKLQRKERPVRDGMEPLSIKQEDARFDAEYSAKKKSLWVNLGIALGLTGLAVAACIVPVAGLVVGAIVIATFATQYGANYYIAKSSKRALDAKFTELEQADEAREYAQTIEHELSHAAELIVGLGAGPHPELASQQDTAATPIASAAMEPIKVVELEEEGTVVDGEPTHMKHSRPATPRSEGYFSKSNTPVNENEAEKHLGQLKHDLFEIMHGDKGEQAIVNDTVEEDDVAEKPS